VEVVVTGLVGLGGVMVGVALTGVIDLWRQLLDGRAAARIIRMEINENANRAVLSATHSHPGIRMRDDAWRDLRVKLAPLLPNAVLHHLATGYGAIFIVEDWVSKIQQKGDEAKAQIRQWAEAMMLDSSFLSQLEKRSRLTQMMDLLRGMPTFPPPVKGERPTKEQFAELRDKLFGQNEVTQL